MTKHDERAIDLEIEVPGTPEQVWEAIATGPGISAWMHPTQVEERAGGRFSFDMGFGPNGTGVVAAWEPPHRFVQEVEWKPSDERPGGELATEWLVEARSGGTCVVRMVMSGFGPGDDWDDELAGMAEGMQVALENLRIHLAHSAGRAGAWVRVFGTAPGGRDAGWAALTAALGLDDAAEGARVSAAGPGVPPLAGVVERVFTGRWRRDVLLRTDSPDSGIAAVSVHGDAGFASVQLCLHGDDAAERAAREEPAWRAWMTDHFPTAG